jgi:hypothetical protein
MNSLCESGRGDGKQSLINLLYNYLDSWASYLFNPTELRFAIGYIDEQPKINLDRAKAVATLLTDTWQSNNTDIVFAAGVQEAGKYGCSLLKQWVQPWDEHGTPNYCSNLVLPWNFGVYAENENDLASQPAMCETVILTMPQVWQRISQLPMPREDREKLFKRVAASAKAGQSSDYNQNFFRQVFSTSPLDVNGVSGSPGKATPGGVVWFGNQAMGTLAPQIGVEIAQMHEIWVQDTDDYSTIQIIEPDIILTPREGKDRENLLIPGQNCGLHPYTLIQPNITPGYFWGRSALTDLIAPQAMLSDLASDIMRLFGVQFDKLVAFSGYDGLADEKYDEYRQNGYFNMPAGASATDITPKLPEQSLPLLKAFMGVFNLIGGMPDILQGKGEQGVRAGSHAETLVKTGSPRMRQSSLIAERQCAAAGETTLSMMQAKDARTYWTKAEGIQEVEQTQFHLTDLPESRRVSIDSHSSSPIFADDLKQEVAFGLKAGYVTKHAAIDLSNLPNKELLHAELREQEKKAQESLQALQKTNPELAEKLILKRGGHH